MYVRRVDNLDDLHAYQSRWDELAGDCVFRSWTWLTTWWKHYGSGSVQQSAADSQRTLAVLLVFADAPDGCPTRCVSTESVRATDGRPLGILPGYVESSLTQGQQFRMLGDGEVCSEYLDLLCAVEDVDQVAATVANFLVTNAPDWECLQLTNVCSRRTKLMKLVDALQESGCHVVQRSGPHCWTIPLPDSWDGFLAMQSKSHRKQLRRLETRVLHSGRACERVVQNEVDFSSAWNILIDLHQRRRQSLGEPGCFSSPDWATFHRDVALQLLGRGQLRLSLLNLDGEPIAAEYHFAGRDAIYAYQGGLDPARCADEPGRLSFICCLQRAIQEGVQEFDLLRGDEPYKAHWRAQPYETVDLQIVSPRLLARWRHIGWNNLRRVVRLVKQATNLPG